MSANPREQFRATFYDALRTSESALLLKQAALMGRLGAWTQALTSVVVEAGRKLGWKVSAKSHKLDLLPVQRSEYLGMDVIALIL